MERIETYALKMEKSCNVYFISDLHETVVKIGTTTREIEVRLRDIQAYSPLKLKILKKITGWQRKEKELHVKFEKYRRHGEWFFLRGSLKKYINDLNNVDFH